MQALDRVSALGASMSIDFLKNVDTASILPSVSYLLVFGTGVIVIK